MIKICPACGHANPAAEMICRRCATFVADVEPTDDATARADGAPDDATVRAPSLIHFLDEDGRAVFACAPGDVVGRSHVGAGYLRDFPTVSRSHCKINFGPEGWTVEDLNSLNGVWVNGARISTATPLKDGDELRLSQARALRVKL